ncbi:hypothetical protein ACFWYW_43105 [Nonomuraea sp. NPDC059023]|uniref:hypothetical protein n=1 Tax=unclassified Nonomuraea TaxID=2593643 RepID=UPI0036C36B96
MTLRATATTPAERPTARRWLVVLLSVLAGFLLTVVWSAEFVDQTIGASVADTLLGHDASETPIAGILAGVVFAFVTGLAGTFTACNIAAMGAVAPLVGAGSSAGARMARTLKPLGWLAVGVLAASGVYGFVVGLAGTAMPQFANSPPAGGLLARNIQSMVTFGLIGLILVFLGLAALGLVGDPLARLERRFPNARMLVMGALIGAFLIGRPFGLFRQLFRDAAASHNPLYGALAFMLQSLGNIVVMAALVLLLALALGGRAQRWLGARPGRPAVITGTAFVVAGSFTALYWVGRLLGRFEIIWWPTAPWV